MLGNDNIMTTKASEVVQNVPTDKKRWLQMLLVCYSFHTATTYSVEKGLMLISQIHCSLKNSRRHFKICTEKGAITGPWWVL